jgi:hypothetical protein
MKDFYNLLFEVIVPGKYDEFIKTSIKTIDSYGLGFSLIYIINQLETNMENREFVRKMQTFGYKMTTPDIRKRIGVQEALHEYETILESTGILQKHRMHKMKYNNNECSPGKLFNTTKKRCIKIK